MLENTRFPVREVPATIVNGKGELDHVANTCY